MNYKRSPLLLLILLGCTDYNVRQTDEVPLPMPVILVDPLEIVTEGFCADSSHEVVLSSVGQDALEITELSFAEGSEGWTIGDFTVPVVIPAGESVSVPLVATGGFAQLVVVSTDPNRHEVPVDLDSVKNTPPTVELMQPYEGAVIFENELLCRALVQDQEDDNSTLGVHWTASPSEWTNSDSPGVDGLVEALWGSVVTEDDEHVMYEVQLDATDSCGEVTSVTATLCRGSQTTHASVDPSNWQFRGTAGWDTDNDWLELTHRDEGGAVGSAFETQYQVSGADVRIDFAFYIGGAEGGDGADGFSLTALDINRIDTDSDGEPNFLGGAGCAMGFGGNSGCTDTFGGEDVGPALPGWSIEVDTYYNPEDGVDTTSLDHVTFYFDGDLLNMAAMAELPEMEDPTDVPETSDVADGAWHTMSVVVDAPHVQVSIDDVVYIDEDLQGVFDFPAYVGFTAGTGGDTNHHLISGLTVTESSCD